MSNLASHINFAKMQQSMAQQQLRNSEAETQSSLEGWRHDSADTFQRIKSYTHRHGDNFSMGTDSRSGMSSQATQGMQKIMDAVQSYARSHGVSEQDAYNELEKKSRDASLEVSAGIRPFGIGVGANAKVSSGSDSSVTQSGSLDDSTRAGKDARLAQSFSEGWSMTKSATIADSAGNVESDGRDELKQIQYSMQETDNHYQDYSRSKSRTKELSRMASMNDSESATVTSNLNQEFVAWVREKYPTEARQLLTNTDSAENREQVAQYANAFVAERVKGRLEQHHQAASTGGKTGFDSGEQEENAVQPESAAPAKRSGAVKTKAHSSGVATQQVATGESARPESAPVRTNKLRRFEEEKNAMENEDNDFRSKVLSKQRENETSVNQAGVQLLKDKNVVSEDINQAKQHYDEKKRSVSRDIKHSKDYQKVTSTFDEDNAINIRKK